MTDFNPWNILLNTINAYGRNNVQNSNANNTVQNQQIIPQNNTFQPQTQTTPLNLIMETQQNAAVVEQLKMENEVVQKYLQNILNMPQTFDKFVQEALNGNESYQFLKIFLQNMMNTRELALLLNQNSKEAMQKMMNIISESLKLSGANMEQLRDILAVLSSIHTNTSSLDSNALKELFLLYIPINYQIYKEDGDYSKFIEENKDIINQGSMNILFQTENFSNMFVALMEDNGTVYVEMYVDESFPFDKFKTTVKELSNQISVKSEFNCIHIKTVENESKKQNFKILSNDFISLNVLLVSYTIIKTIFKIDDDMKTI